jgi:nucleoside-diphosphate-sugar epimerase
MRVLVIGATGHIGSYLVPRLVEDGHEVVAMSRGARRPYVDHPAWQQVSSVAVDRDAEDAAGTFGATAAAVGAGAVIDLMCFTLASAQQLVDALAPARPYLLHCGTIWVHGPATEVPVTENAARQPFGDYGTQKAQIESFLLGPVGRGTLPATVLHPGHIVGPGWAPLGPAGNFDVEVFARLARGQELALPNFGLETVHHVHAADVAQAFTLALARPDAAVGEAFHVVSERAITLRGYAAAVARWFGHESRLSFEPFATWAAAWGASEAETTWEHIARSPSMSIAKAAKALGYQPRYSSLEAVFESLAWLVGNGQVDVAGRALTFC